MGSSPVSAQLAAAQTALDARRRALGLAPCPPDRRPLPPPPPTLLAALNRLPTHLGWGSDPASRAVRAAQERRRRAAAPQSPHPPTQPPPLPTQPLNTPGELTIYPDLALALLRTRTVAAGRVWLILRALDTQSQGWLPLNTVRQALTGPKAPHRLCGERQLRKLLARGDDLFWTRDETRLWLRGQARVAATMGVERLALDPVALPLRRLCGPIRQARAQLYATFHSSRAARDRAAKRRDPAPIARATLRRLAGRERRTQRAYEQAAGVLARRNVALGPPVNTPDRDTLGWRRGTALFVLEDFGGRHGPAGIRYFAWQLPNSYAGARGQRVRRHGGRRRLNRRLTDLLAKGRTGNSQPDASAAYQTPRFYPDAAAACRSAARDRDVYWPAVLGATQVWFTPCPR